MAFPQEVYQFQLRTEILASDVPYVQRFQELKLKANRTPEEETEMSNLMARLRSKFISSDDWNQFQNALVEMQLFLKNNVEGYIDGMVVQVDVARDNALIAIDQKKNAIIVYLDSLEAGKLRNDIGVMAELSTTVKSSLVAAVNEVNSKAPTDASTTQKGIVQLSSTSSTSEVLAATPKLVKDVSDALTTHSNIITTSAHGSTSVATANRIIQRDANGRAKVAAPSAVDDIARLDTITGQVGALSSLQTTAKTNTVAAINELFQSVGSGKGTVETAITGKGGTVSKAGSVATFPELVSGVNSIQQGQYYRMRASQKNRSVAMVNTFPANQTLANIASFTKGTKVVSFSGQGSSYQLGSIDFYAHTGSDYTYATLGLLDSAGVFWNLLINSSSNSALYFSASKIYVFSSTIDFQTGVAVVVAGRESSTTIQLTHIRSNMPTGFNSASGTISLIMRNLTNNTTGSTVTLSYSVDNVDIVSM